MNSMKLTLFTILAVPSLSALAVAFCTSADRVLASAQDTPSSPLRYERAKEGGVQLYNVADLKGDLVTTIPARTLCAVYSEANGLKEIEPASGLEVWVFGQYLKTTGTPGTFEIAGNMVNMRPQPNNGEHNFPLRQTLHAGDKVRGIARNDATKPLAKDWVKIYAPAGTHVFAASNDLVASADATDPKTLWASAVSDARAKGKVWSEAANADADTAKSVAKEAAAGAAKPNTKADGASTEAADKLYDAQKDAAKPDFSAAKAAYKKIIDGTPTSASADHARRRLEQIDLHEEVARLRSDKAMAEAKRQEELKKAEQALRESDLASDPLWGRFQSRGLLERDGSRWIVRWSGKVAAEVVCTSKRYELALFEGCEVGVLGALERSANADSGMPARVDVQRIEVLAGRAPRL